MLLQYTLLRLHLSRLMSLSRHMLLRLHHSRLMLHSRLMFLIQTMPLLQLLTEISLSDRNCSVKVPLTGDFFVVCIHLPYIFFYEFFIRFFQLYIYVSRHIRDTNAARLQQHKGYTTTPSRSTHPEGFVRTVFQFTEPWTYLFCPS